jgi:hypothetical protein
MSTKVAPESKPETNDSGKVKPKKNMRKSLFSRDVDATLKRLIKDPGLYIHEVHFSWDDVELDDSLISALFEEEEGVKKEEIFGPSPFRSNGTERMHFSAWDDIEQYMKLRISRAYSGVHPVNFVAAAGFETQFGCLVEQNFVPESAFCEDDFYIDCGAFESLDSIHEVKDFLESFFPDVVVEFKEVRPVKKAELHLVLMDSDQEAIGGYRFILEYDRDGETSVVFENPETDEREVLSQAAVRLSK